MNLVWRWVQKCAETILVNYIWRYKCAVAGMKLYSLSRLKAIGVGARTIPRNPKVWGYPEIVLTKPSPESGRVPRNPEVRRKRRTPPKKNFNPTNVNTLPNAKENRSRYFYKVAEKSTLFGERAERRPSLLVRNS